MSQIGNEKGGLEMIGRLLGSVDGKAGRVAAKLGSGASQDFARLMASAQGRLNGGQAAPSTTGEHAKGGAALPDQLRSALNALGEEMARLRQRLASDASAQASLGEGGQDVRATLEQMVEALSSAGGRQGAGQGRSGDGISALREDSSRNGRMPAPSQAAGEQGPGSVDSAVTAALESGSPGDNLGDLPARQEASRSTALDRLASDEAFAGKVAELAEALADWRQALDAGVPAQTEVAADALRERLAALRESMQAGALASGEQSSGLIGQLQALQQLMARAETARSGDNPAARSGAEPRAWSEWSWRMTGGGQHAAARSASAAPALAGGAPDGDTSDWSGGPVTAALGLAGREMPDQSRSERMTPTHWSALGGLSAQSADAATETMTSPAAGLGQAASAPSSISSGQSAGGIFTGQAATPPPNPQMPAQLGQQIQWMVGKGVSRANIELRPADLGPLKISIETQGDETRIALTATNATTQGLLEQQLPRLKEWLQESGLAQSEVDVSLADEGDFGQQLANTEGEESGEQGGLTGDAEAMASAGSSTDGGDAAEWVDGPGVLDLFA